MQFNSSCKRDSKINKWNKVHYRKERSFTKLRVIAEIEYWFWQKNKINKQTKKHIQTFWLLKCVIFIPRINKILNKKLITSEITPFFYTTAIIGIYFSFCLCVFIRILHINAVNKQMQETLFIVYYIPPCPFFH